MSATQAAPMMACGHAANSVHHRRDGVDEPACVICAPSPEAYTIAPEPDLSQRQARCFHYGGKTRRSECRICDKRTDGQCRCERPSATRQQLPFFAHHPTKEFDEFYCGCHSWD